MRMEYLMAVNVVVIKLMKLNRLIVDSQLSMNDFVVSNNHS